MVKYNQKDYYFKRLNISSDEVYNNKDPKVFIRNSVNYIFQNFQLCSEKNDFRPYQHLDDFILQLIPWYANHLSTRENFQTFVNTPSFVMYYLENNALYSKALTVSTNICTVNKLSTFGNPLAWRKLLIEKRIKNHFDESSKLLFPYIIEPTENKSVIKIRACLNQFSEDHQIITPTYATRLQNVGFQEHFG